eukprot:TRINITY_DN13876_c0_g1_i2.p1 TRINITY_DN13876_c0_g1~~TRINITY_DN13876_c0_g1_i2.p1  ORF type:complete len:395 (-),score=59.89 TRINITY_DN13876_c0_g1_i2:98-1162(-)
MDREEAESVLNTAFVQTLSDVFDDEKLALQCLPAIAECLQKSVGRLETKAFQELIDFELISKLYDFLLRNPDLFIGQHSFSLAKLFSQLVCPTTLQSTKAIMDRRFMLLMSGPIGKCLVRLTQNATLEQIAFVCQSLHALYGCHPDDFRRQIDSTDLELLLECEKYFLQIRGGIMADRIGYLARHLSNYVLSAKEEVVKSFYKQYLLENSPLNEEMALLIVEYFVEGYRVGQMIDARSSNSRKWRAAEVTQVEDDRILVRFIGFQEKDWYHIPTHEIVPAFTYTGITGHIKNPPRHNFGQESLKRIAECLLLEPSLGASSEKEVIAAFEAYGNEVQTVVNYLRYTNRHKLARLL